MENFKNSSRAWSAPSVWSMTACIALAALCASSCRTSQRAEASSLSMARQEQSREQTEAGRQTLLVQREPVPADTLTLRMPIDALTALPGGAAYTARRGRASASVRIEGDTVVVTSACDSLSALVAYYAAETLRWQEAWERSELEAARHEAEARRRGRPPWVMGVLILSIGPAFGVLAGWLVCRLRRG